MWHLGPMKERQGRAVQRDISGFLRHVNNCRNVVLPDGRLRFWLGDQPVGWVRAEVAATLARFPRVVSGADGVRLEDAPALPAIAQALSRQHVFRWRDEAFDVRAEPDGPVLSVIDRGALPVFGIEAVGVHVNGLVEDTDGLSLWIGRRSADRPLDPGKLDHLVGGGVPAGLTPAATLVKEAGEEAAIPPELAAQSVHVGVIRYVMERAEGLRRDLLHCYDLVLPKGFQPARRRRDGMVPALAIAARCGCRPRHRCIQVQRQSGADRPVPATWRVRRRNGSRVAHRAGRYGGIGRMAE